MKNFFSQTWVVAGLVIIVLGVVTFIAFKSSKEETDPANTENKE